MLTFLNSRARRHFPTNKKQLNVKKTQTQAQASPHRSVELPKRVVIGGRNSYISPYQPLNPSRRNDEAPQMWQVMEPNRMRAILEHSLAKHVLTGEERRMIEQVIDYLKTAKP